MKNVQIRHVPDRTHLVLKRRADRSGKSLQEYLLETLNDLADRPTVEEVMDRVRRRSGGRVGFGAAVKALREERSAR